MAQAQGLSCGGLNSGGGKSGGSGSGGGNTNSKTLSKMSSGNSTTCSPYSNYERGFGVDCSHPLGRGIDGTVSYNNHPDNGKSLHFGVRIPFP